MGKLETLKILVVGIIVICLYNIFTTHSSLVLFGSSFIGAACTVIAMKLNKE